MRGLRGGRWPWSMSCGRASRESRGGPRGRKKARGPAIPKGPKLKQIRWDTISEDEAADSIWASNGAKKKRFSVVQKDGGGMFGDLEDLFGAKKTKDPKEASGAKKKKVKKGDVTLLDGKRAQNLGIAISRLWSGTWDALGNAVDQLDTRKIGPENIETLDSVLPTAKEMKAQLAYTGDRSMMNKTDHFIFAMAKVKRLDAKVKCMLFQCKFNEIFKPLDKSIMVVTKALMKFLKAKLKS